MHAHREQICEQPGPGALDILSRALAEGFERQRLDDIWSADQLRTMGTLCMLGALLMPESGVHFGQVLFIILTALRNLCMLGAILMPESGVQFGQVLFIIFTALRNLCMLRALLMPESGVQFSQVLFIIFTALRNLCMLGAILMPVSGIQYIQVHFMYHVHCLAQAVHADGHAHARAWHSVHPGAL